MKIDEIGFSLWCDFVERDFLEGRFRELIRDGVIKGATSNPAIFQKSFTASSAYKDEIALLRAQGIEPKRIYETLAVRDIARAAQILAPLNEKNPEDGFISIEVDPFLCDDSSGTISEGVRLFETIGYKNVMIKVPATNAGYQAMEELIAKGISVNATLIFSKEQAQACLDAFARGYDRTKELPQSVISIFVSRLDRKCDEKISSAGLKIGELGIRNAQRIYRLIEESKPKATRALFASTGVKGNSLTPSYYVDSLLHRHSINTAPLETIEAFIKSGNSSQKYLSSREDDERYFLEVKNAGIELNSVFDALINEGIALFKESFDALLATLK